LREVPPALRDGVPNRDVLRDSILNAAPEAWDYAYSLLSGSLPLAEMHKPGRPEVMYLQGEIQVVQGGAVEVRVDSTEPVTFWIDEDAFEKQTQATVSLAPGRHRITLRVVVGESPAAGVRVELRKAADSRVHFEMIHAD